MLTLGYPMQPFQGKKLKKPPTGRVHSRQMMSFLILQVLVCRMNLFFYIGLRRYRMTLRWGMPKKRFFTKMSTCGPGKIPAERLLFNRTYTFSPVGFMGLSSLLRNRTPKFIEFVNRFETTDRSAFSFVGPVSYGQAGYDYPRTITRTATTIGVATSRKTSQFHGGLRRALSLGIHPGMTIM